MTMEEAAAVQDEKKTKRPAMVKDTRSIKDGCITFNGLVFRHPDLERYNGFIAKCEMPKRKGETEAKFIVKGVGGADVLEITINGEKKQEPKMTKDEWSFLEWLKVRTGSGHPLKIVAFIIEAKHHPDKHIWSVPTSDTIHLPESERKYYQLDEETLHCPCEGYRRHQSCSHHAAVSIRIVMEMKITSQGYSSGDFDDDIPF
jgi:hypothetical protein